MKRIVFLFAAIVFVLAAFAQSKVEQMNNIKKNKSYLYADMTMADKTEALVTAYKLLQENIVEWAKGHAKKNMRSVMVSDVRKIIDTIFLDRVNMVQAFVYVKKVDVIPIYSKQGVTIIDPDAVDVIIDEGKQQTAKIDTSERKKDTLMVKVDSVAKTRNDTLTAKVAEANTDTLSQKARDALKRITEVSSFFDLQRIMEPMKEEGIITAYGKYSTMDTPEECYLIIYDPAGNIRAVLGKGSEQRINLNTQRQDSETNYRGCGAIWFKLKEKA